MLAYLAGVSVFGAVGFYLMFVYIVSWLQFADGIAPAQALTINTISMALLIPAEIGLAALSDRIGRRPVLLAVTGLAVVAAWPLFWLMHGHEPWMVLAGQLGFVVLVGGYYGCLPAFMVEAVGGRSALHGHCAGLQRRPRRARRPQSAGRDLAGAAHRRTTTARPS